jgi:hypothetical protein
VDVVDVRQTFYHEAYISQLTLYSKACAQQHHFMNRAQLLTLKLFKPDYVVPLFKSSLQKSYGCHHELVDNESIPFGVHLFLFDTTVIKTRCEPSNSQRISSPCFLYDTCCAAYIVKFSKGLSIGGIEKKQMYAKGNRFIVNQFVMATVGFL